MSTSTPQPELSRPVSRLVAEGTAVRPMTGDQRDELWRRIAHRAGARRPAPAKATFVLAAAVAGIALLAWAVRSTPEAPRGTVAEKRTTRAPQPQTRIVHLGTRADLELRADAQLTLPPGIDANRRGTYRVRLERGQLAALVGRREADEPLAVETPQLTVIVVGTRFSVDVDDAVTKVAVDEGRVRVERGTHAVLLSAGESIRSDDERLNHAPVAPACAAAGPLVERRACLRRQADGPGLAAENALLALGLLDSETGADRSRALASLREYQRRFPAGVLAPEVALAITSALAAEGRHAQACAEADAFSRRFPDDRGTRDRLLRVCGR
jgi:hypothetical protein